MEDRPCTRPWHAEARRLHALGLTHVQIAKAVGIGKSSVGTFLNPYAYAVYLRAQRERYARSAKVRAERNARSRQWFQDNKELACMRNRIRRKLVRAQRQQPAE